MSSDIADNVAIQRDVLDEIDWASGIDSTDVGVEVDDGVVTLTGTVDSYWKKVAAAEAAQKVFGVRAVANDIEVRPPGDAPPDDTQIARIAANRFDWSTAVPRERINITVDNGQVILYRYC